MRKKGCTAIAAFIALCILLISCAGFAGSGNEAEETLPKSGGSLIHTEGFLSFVDEEPDTLDPQCTSEFYTVPLNVFNRLVEIEVNDDGSSEIVPSLAQSWTISEDGLTYTFHLEEGVTFSNGSPLTASDVGYTFTRVLTNPNSCNQDVAAAIAGAQALRDGQAKTLEGFHQLGEYDFSITLKEPYAAFLACLSTPGASILDQETTEEAGSRFGSEAEWMIGTGPFILREWKHNSKLILVANENCWAGPPRCRGLEMEILTDSEAQRLMFENGRLDILDLESLGSEAEYFVHGDIYQELLHQGPRVGISYLALNESIKPLNDVRVRKALQLSLDRQTLLDAVYSGRGQVEHGIFPHGLIGYNPALPEIPYDPQAARDLLKEAGYESGFDLILSYPSSASQSLKELLTLSAYMWQKIGVRAQVQELDDNWFMAKRKNGELACYSSTWSADFNDPDNFIYTFFGNQEYTDSRSLCYSDKAVMDRVAKARAIVDEKKRLAEYQALERKIIQEDAAWVPLYSREHYFVVNQRVDGFEVSWNGWSSNCYRDVAVEEP